MIKKLKIFEQGKSIKMPSEIENHDKYFFYLSGQFNELSDALDYAKLKSKKKSFCTMFLVVERSDLFCKFCVYDVTDKDILFKL